jgi:nitroimidazol reductase NimA-like FMN-containing flavoprotein (pyridoxamine 5'-phosphate oxidase superfamily)
MKEPGTEDLPVEECLELLGAATLGRVAVRLGDAPAILPVNYALLDDEVVFRTDPGTKLTAALMGVRVAFEVDAADPDARNGWSVLVVGYAEEIRDRSTLRRVDELGLKPWVAQAPDFVVRIRAERITGRRVSDR